MIHDPIRRNHPLVSLWDSARHSLIEGHVSNARTRIARLIRRLRSQNERDLVRPVLGYVIWIGYPISDQYMSHKYPS